MNEYLLQSDCLDQLDNWLPATLAGIGKQQGDGLEQPDSPHEGETEILCGGSAESSLSGYELNELESSGHSSPGLEPNGHSVRNSSREDRFERGGGGSTNSKPSHRDQSNEKLTMVIREMKQYLPAEKVESCSKASTLSTLNYALKRGKDQGQEKRFHPFRITPYLVHVCDSDLNEAEPCCLALAEKMHSGYEAPRIPAEKRIFTTTHTPGYAFLEIDDRAVPLLGYLPQELIGTSILMHLHPEDRPVVVAVHRKVLRLSVTYPTSPNWARIPYCGGVCHVLRFAGHPPFEHAPIRFCTRNGDYVVLDTSWSSFVNPRSRKVVFVVGRHKARTSPLNEDVFAAGRQLTNCVDKETWELQGQIYKLLLQPVHSKGSSGYGSLVSSGSYEHYISVASSSDSNGNCVEEIQKEPMTRQQVCVDVNRLKNMGQQLYMESHRKQHTASRLPRAMNNSSSSNTGERPAAASFMSTHHLLSYQQINCMDSIISYNIPALKRKCESSVHVSSSEEEEDKRAQLSQDAVQILGDASKLDSVTSQLPAVAKLEGDVAVVGAPMTDPALRTKAPSMVSVTSQCSDSSTLVHFPHPESEATALEEVPLLSEQVDLPHASVPSTAPEEEIQRVGLTKEVLSAHTQKEEQNYVDCFRQRFLLPPYRLYLQHTGAGSNLYPSQERGDFLSKETSPASSKRNGKQEEFQCQKQPASSGDHGNAQAGSCEKAAAALGGPWVPSEEPPPGPFGGIPPANPFVGPGFPMAPLAGSPPAFPVVPPYLAYGLQPIPAFHTPYMGTVMAVLLQGFPTYAFVPAQQAAATASSSVSFPSAAALPPPPLSVGPLSSAPFLPKEGVPGPPGDQAPLFSHSRSGSPLQLDLLQEELPRPLEPPSTALAKTVSAEALKHEEDGVHANGRSISSELLDLLLLEDSQSGTSSAASGSGSAESGSFVSGSNRTSGCGTGSSKYFASNDSSEVSEREKKNPDEERKGPSQPTRMKEEVLKEDLEKLADMEGKQPCFTEGQQRELAEVHPWIRTQTIPQEINIQGCITCESRSASYRVASPNARDPPEKEQGGDPHLPRPLPPRAPD